VSFFYKGVNKMKKVKFGLKNVHVFPITKNESNGVTYAQAIKIDGAVSISLKASGDSDNFYADDVIYFNQFSNNGYEGDLEIALIPEKFETEILGFIKDKNGAIVEDSNIVGKSYAMAFEFSSDEKATRHILYNCSSSRPDVEGETKKEKMDPKTDKISIKAVPALDTGYVKAKIEQGNAEYDTFFTKPYKVVIQNQ
jgi:phage major tail protein, phi13 family